MPFLKPAADKPGEGPEQRALLDAARRGHHEAFQRLAEPHRRELQLHCYRMLGSFHDAEDLVQETLLRAWRGLGGFEPRAPGSFRGWLFRIATNACLNALAGRGRASRVLPEELSPPADRMPQAGPAIDVPWLEPFPDTALAGIADGAPGPDSRYEMREAVQLAFIAAIQHLPARQRAALLLQDVMGWSAVETAELLGRTVASVNSALQRARATLEKRFPAGRPRTPPVPAIRQRALLASYVRAWEGADLDGFAALLREDSILSMPPWREWYRGGEAIVRFCGWTVRPGGSGAFRLVPAGANRQPAYAFYRHGPDGPQWRAHSIQVLTLDGDAIAAMTSFVTPRLFGAFGLPDVLAG
jgi:RNA polymerase sigma-70 factor (ECF subfamily)